MNNPVQKKAKLLIHVVIKSYCIEFIAKEIRLNRRICKHLQLDRRLHLIRLHVLLRHRDRLYVGSVHLREVSLPEPVVDPPEALLAPEVSLNLVTY